jgi:hypothetical protein
MSSLGSASPFGLSSPFGTSRTANGMNWAVDGQFTSASPENTYHAGYSQFDHRGQYSSNGITSVAPHINPAFFGLVGMGTTVHLTPGQHQDNFYSYTNQGNSDGYSDQMNDWSQGPNNSS